MASTSWPSLTLPFYITSAIMEIVKRWNRIWVKIMSVCHESQLNMTTQRAINPPDKEKDSSLGLHSATGSSLRFPYLWDPNKQNIINMCKELRWFVITVKIKNKTTSDVTVHVSKKLVELPGSLAAVVQSILRQKLTDETLDQYSLVFKEKNTKYKPQDYKRTINSRPSISKSSFSTMLGSRGKESRNPICNDKYTLIQKKNSFHNQNYNSNAWKQKSVFFFLER